MNFNHDTVIIALCAIVLISHFFNLISRISRIPSVLLLIGFGILLRVLSGVFDIDILNTSKYLGVLGTVGLILIVLEGTSDLKLKRQNVPIIKGSFGAAFFILILATSSIAALLYFWLKIDFRSAFVNAIPLGVISSSVAIPTVVDFIKHKKEFLTYESIFSDIIGIMLFNFMITPSALNVPTVRDFFFKFIIVIIVSIVGSYLLLFSLNNMKTQTKFFIILSLLILLYAVGSIFQLPSLLIVFVFGLLLNNPTIIPGKILTKNMKPEEIDTDLDQFKSIVAESAFLIRTFFFVIFGYSIDILHVFNWNVLMIGTPIVLILFFVRFIYLKLVIKSHVFPEIFIAPKGLVTIVLFYSIPPAMAIGSFSEGGVLFFVILVTGLLMIASGFSQKHFKTLPIPDNIQKS